MSEARERPADADATSATAQAEAVPTAEAVAEVMAAEGDDPVARVCEVALEEFEGPLDLLLHLVRRHELDILDIPIAFVCEKYLEYIEFMRALDLEVAGDYLVMAATLAYLKSRELVPQFGEEEGEEGSDEDGPDPREQLIARLLEYQTFKDAAHRLDQQPMAGRDTFGRGQEVEMPPVDTGLAPITLFRLAEAYQRVLERARIHRSHEVVLETVSVAERMQQLTTLLVDRGRFEFEGIFLEREWSSEGELRSMLVVTLMSVLELVRMGVARVHQPVGADTIVVERVASAEQAAEALRGYDEKQSYGDASEGGASDEGLQDDDALDDDEAAATEGPEVAFLDHVVVSTEPSEPAEGEDVVAGEAMEPVVEAAGGDAVGEAMEPVVEALEGDAVGEAIVEPVDVVAGEAADAVIPPAAELAEVEEVMTSAIGEAEPLEPEMETFVTPDGPAAEAGEGAAEATETPLGPDLPPQTPAAAASPDEPGSMGTDAGVAARSVVSESPPSEAADDGVGQVAAAEGSPERALGSTEGDVEEHGENGQAEAGEGS